LKKESGLPPLQNFPLVNFIIKFKNFKVHLHAAVEAVWVVTAIRTSRGSSPAQSVFRHNFKIVSAIFSAPLHSQVELGDENGGRAGPGGEKGNARYNLGKEKLCIVQVANINIFSW
jgi:hypothetical protein